MLNTQNEEKNTVFDSYLACYTENDDADAADTYDSDTDAAAYGGDEL